MRCPIHGESSCFEVEASVAVIVASEHVTATIDALRAIPTPAGHRLVEGPVAEPNDDAEERPGTMWVRYVIEGDGDNTAWFDAAERLPHLLYIDATEAWG